jgi:hypothetical protein
MSDLQAYFLAQREKEVALARADYNNALADSLAMRARLAELKSQHEPLGTMARELSGKDCLQSEHRKIRAAMYAAAFYAVVGRMPEGNEGVE